LPFFDIEGQNYNIEKKTYDVVHDIVTRYEDAPNPLLLPPDIKPDIVEKEQRADINGKRARNIAGGI
jgi:hypothetical protein